MSPLTRSVRHEGKRLLSGIAYRIRTLLMLHGHVMREKKVVRVALALILLLGILVMTLTPPSYASRGSAAIEQEFIEAENDSNEDSALRKWKALLQKVSHNDVKELPGYMAPDRIQRVVVDIYMQRYVRSRDQAKAIEAYDYVNGLTNPETRLWGLLYFLQRATQSGGLQGDQELLSLAQDASDSIYYDAVKLAPATRERLYYGLGMVLTSKEGQATYSEKDLQRVHALIVRLEDPQHRVDLVQQFGALTKSFGPALYPVTFQRLYLAFSDAEPDTDTLLAIHKEAVGQDHFNAALYALLAIKDSGTQTSKLKDFFQALMEKGAMSRAQRVAEQTHNPAACVSMWSQLMREYLYYGYDAKAEASRGHATTCAQVIAEDSNRQKALQLIEERQKEGQAKHAQYTEPDIQKKQALEAQIDKLLAEKGLVYAITLIKGQADTKLRVRAFRYLAEQQAKRLDQYAALKNDTPYEKLTDDISYVLNQPKSKKQKISDPTFKDVKAQEAVLRKAYGGDASNVMAYEGVSSTIGQVIHYNALPQQAKISGELVRAKLPLPHGGRVALSHYESNIFNSSFIHLFGNSGFVLGQHNSAPLVVTIEDGIFDLPTIYDELADLGNVRCMEKQDKVYTLHCPLIVGTNATLVMSGDSASEMRLSTQSGSYLLNANIIFMSDIKLVGWDDDHNRPMWFTYEDRYRFRPFLTAWNRSYSYIGNSEITALGYDHGKSYGICFSSGPNSWEKLGDIDYNERPTGAIVDSSFRNMMFGFYSYEAYNAVVVGNEYVDNIVYGIDPHDRSTHLVIAYNTAYGAKKHGIIVSRDVGKSLIAGNLVFSNHGSGIMLDRDSNENLIYANTAIANDQEGITLFESNCNVIASNNLLHNIGAGIRLRNSHDVGLYHNQIAYNNHGINAYTMTLEETPTRRNRDLAMDPYANITGFAAVGNLITGNATGIYINDIDGMFLKQNEFVKQGSSIVRGDWFSTRMQDILEADAQKKGAVISRICPTTRTVPPEQPCMFRENATLRGDGLDLLLGRLSLPQCQEARKNVAVAKGEVKG